MLSLLSFRVFTSLIDDEEFAPYPELRSHPVGRDLSGAIPCLRSLVCATTVQFALYNDMTPDIRECYLNDKVNTVDVLFITSVIN